MRHSSIIVIPTYNEAENIEPLISEIFNVLSDIDILVVDDNSPDGTAQILKRLMEKNLETYQRAKNNISLITKKRCAELHKNSLTA